MARILLLKFMALVLWIQQAGAGTITQMETTKVTGPSSACIGQPLDLTCDILSDNPKLITWVRGDNINVATCQEGTACILVNDYNVTFRTENKQILRIQNFSSTDGGLWTCQDNSGNPGKLTVEALEAPKVSNLQVTCRQSNDSNYVVACSGLASHGSPEVELALQVDDVERKRFKAMDFTTLLPDLGGKQVTCSVAGPAKECLTVTAVLTKCPGTKWRGLTTGQIFGIVICACLLFVIFLLLIDYKCCLPYGIGCIHTLKGCCGKKNSSFTPESAPMTDKTDAGTAATTTEASTLLKENEKDETPKELEPEDKDPQAGDPPQPKPRTVIGSEKEAANE